MKKILFTVTLLLFGYLSVHAQTKITVYANQASKLEAKSGNDTEIAIGESVTLGTIPSATGGTIPYSYSWNDGTNDFSSESNPLVSPEEITTYALLVTDNRTCTATDNITISIGVTAINNFTEDELRIYPNPATDGLTIDYGEENCVVSLFDQNGKLMWARLLNGKTTFSTPYTPGIYLLKINASDKERVRRIVITK